MKPEVRFRAQDIIVFTGLSLLIFLTLLVVLCAISRFFGIVNFAAIALIACVVSYILTHRVLHTKKTSLLFGIAISIGIVIFCCIISLIFHDFSYDGNAYHKEAVSALADGWNPLLESVEAWQLEHEVFGECCAIWIDHYPQGAWSIAACFYALTGDIEAGKSYTPILMVSVGLIWGWYLKKKGFTTLECSIVAIILVLNPITSAQFISFYNDAFLMMGLFMLLAGLFMLVDEDVLEFRSLGFLITACAFVLCTETKFTGFAYAGVFSLSFYLLPLARTIRRKIGYSWKLQGIVSLFFAALILFSILVIGYSPYVMNFADHGNIFYPLFGEGAIDIVTNQSPESFENASNIEKLFRSFFSETDNITYQTEREPQLKVPFTFSSEELRNLRTYDLRIGGFGVLYSGILIMQAIIIVALLPRFWRRSRSNAITILCFLVPMVFLTAFLGESWWARYNCYSYFTNAIALVLLFAEYNFANTKRTRIAVKAISTGFSVLLVANSLLFLMFSTYPNLKASLKINEQLAQIEQAVEEGGRVEVAYLAYPGDIYAFESRGIPFDFLGEKDEAFIADGNINHLYYRIIN